MKKIIIVVANLMVVISLVSAILKIVEENTLTININESDQNSQNSISKNVIAVKLSKQELSKDASINNEKYDTQEESNIEDISELSDNEEDESTDIDENSIIESESNDDEELNLEEDSSEEYTDNYEYIYISKDTDLKTQINVTAEDLDNFLDKYTSEDSLLHNQGWAFIAASEASGYNPLFLLALAASESGWETSDIHAIKNNPYSISMYDWDIESGYNMGDSFSDGIINGSVWISDNYYDNHQCTLNQMQHSADHIYASDPNWENTVVSIMNDIYAYILTDEEEYNDDV